MGKENCFNFIKYEFYFISREKFAFAKLFPSTSTRSPPLGHVVIHLTDSKNTDKQ